MKIRAAPPDMRAMLPLLVGIRLQLTLWYVAILTLVLVAFSGLIYAAQARGIDVDARDQLRLGSQKLAASYDPASGQLLLPEQSRPAKQIDWAEKGIDAVPWQDKGLVALLLDPQGRIVQGLGRGADPEVGQQLLKPRSGLLPTRDTFFIIELLDRPGGDASPYLFYATPLIGENVGVGLLLVGQPDRSAARLGQLRLTLLLTAPATLLIAALGGYWLASKALRPVRLIGQAAAEIGATDLSRRLRLPQRDELGELATTFDGMLDRLEAAFARQRQFTADASHELRTPLSIVDLETTHALAAPRTQEDYARSLTIIQAENARMTRLVNSLLVLARADAGHPPLSREPLDLGDLALDVAERLAPLARQRGVLLHTGTLPELPIVGNLLYLTQLLTNLVENAIIYTSGHGTRVCVEVGHWRVGAAAHGWVRVADDGPGIPPEHLPHLFDRFYRVDRARTRGESPVDAGQPGGNGLGLAIARWIAQAHGGEIVVRSTLGQGATFEVRLPLG